MGAPKNLLSGLFATLLIGILGFMSYALVFQTIPVTNRDALVYLLGIVSANIGQVTSYFYGSSASSHRKDETISRIAKGE